MAQIQTNIDLLPYNTFRVAVKASRFLTLTSRKSLKSLTSPLEPILALGNGANILFTRDFQGLILKNELRGRKVVKETDEAVEVELASGENWHELVEWSVNNNLSGIENMALIPGTVGAAATGNIAAYGGNFEDVFVKAQGVNMRTGGNREFSKDMCRFGYRDSAFKDEFSDFLLTSVTIRLSKTARPNTTYHSRYESLAFYLPHHPDTPYTPKEIAQAAIKLRQSKLPDWKKIGTAGSFFKNPNVTWKKYQELSAQITDLQFYPPDKLSYISPDIPDLPDLPDRLVKIPAGRLLDELGWKGKRIGRVGTWPKHALTVVNYGGATGQEILDFANKMKENIKSHFAINLEPEVNIL